MVNVACQAALPISAEDSARSRSSVALAGGLRRPTVVALVASTSQAALAPVPVTSRQVRAGESAPAGSRASGRSSPSSQAGAPVHSASQPFQRAARAAGGASKAASSAVKIR